MIKCRLFLHLLNSLFFLTLFGFSQTQNKPPEIHKIVTEEEHLKLQRESDLSEATPIQNGVINTQQKEMSRLYPGYSTGMKIRDGVEKFGDNFFVHRGAGTRMTMPGETFDAHVFFQNMSRKADAVMMGTVTQRTSFINESDDFIFTTYEIKISEILKDNSINPLKEQEKISVVMPGGLVLLNGSLVKGLDESYLPLHKGLKYLIFLKYVPSTDAYVPFDDRSSFLLTENKVIKLTKEAYPLEDYFRKMQGKTSSGVASGIDPTPFLDLVHSSIVGSTVQ